VLQTPIARTHTTFYNEKKIATVQKGEEPLNPSGEPE